VLGAGCLLAGLALTGCGGAAPKEPVAVQGAGYSFSAPGGWKVTRTGTSAVAARDTGVVSVSTFRLTRDYRPSMWKEAVKELDGVAANLAAAMPFVFHLRFRFPMTEMPLTILAACAAAMLLTGARDTPKPPATRS